MKYAQFKALGLSGGFWWTYVNPGVDCPARKRHRCQLYRLSVEDRHAIHIFIGNRVSKVIYTPPVPLWLTPRPWNMTYLEFHKWNLSKKFRPTARPWWMSQKQYQAMCSRAGVPF